MRKLTIPFALALSLALPLAAHAGVQWTAVPSGGCIIETGSAGIARYTGVGITYEV